MPTTVPRHGWTPPGYPRPYSGPCEMAGGVESCLPASPYPSPPLSTHGRPSSGHDLRWSPVSHLGADDSWSCGDLSTKNQLRSSLPVELIGSTDVIPDDFELSPSNGRQSALTAYTGTIYIFYFFFIILHYTSKLPSFSVVTLLVGAI